MLQVRYYILSILALLLLPVIGWMGRKIRRQVPELPPASGPTGISAPDGATNTFRMLALGESTFAGLGVAEHKKGVVGTLASELSRRMHRIVYWEIYAKSGFNIQKVRRELIPEVTGTEWDLVILGIGGNDLFEWRSPVLWKKYLKALLADLHSQGIRCPVILANLPPVGVFPAFPPLIQFMMRSLADLFHQANLEIVESDPNLWYEGSYRRIESWEALQDTNVGIVDLFSDGVHPSQFTYETWGRALADMIEEQEIWK